MANLKLASLLLSLSLSLCDWKAYLDSLEKFFKATVNKLLLL